MDIEQLKLILEMIQNTSGNVFIFALLWLLVFSLLPRYSN